MDNLCHTLVGAALAEAGLRKRSPLATAALLVGANIPDVDGILYWMNRPVEALGFRRGWTHGVLAMAVWPFVLTGLLLAWDRWVRRRRHPERPPAVPGALLWLSLLAVLTHPLLDLCNTYGVRLLMPFSGHWFHGDTLFIVDPWMWLTLGLGWLVARELRRRGRPRPEWPARWALAAGTAYVVAMAASNLAARGLVRSAALAEDGPPPGRLMVSPRPLDPFRRDVVIQRDSVYELGSFDWLHRPHYRREGPRIARYAGLDAPAVRAAAAATDTGRIFLGWARFPVYEVLRSGGGYEVLLADARYTLSGRARFGAVAIRVPRGLSSPPTPPHPPQESP
ncbi:MAG TPA: metal-dependent hydrolase [Gemmatimonadales bacterium]|nr:metal-dependent hydrolase [Gemmatimonadales bacterium]